MEKRIPVLLIIFNRPEKIQRIMEVLKVVKPPRLFIAADGPRPDHPQDAEKCRTARKTAMDVGWACDVLTRFSDVNLGCDPSVVSAITWFFDHVDHGVILEDDCVPHPHFFTFCGELLERYAHDLRMMQISGLSPYRDRRHPFDYHFSTAFRCHGWATWKRAWQCYAQDLSVYDDREVFDVLREYSINRVHRGMQFAKYRAFKRGDHRFWDFFWNLACYFHRGLCIVPESNLVRNIGFDGEATHTREDEPLFSDCKAHPITFPLRHPLLVFADQEQEKDLDRRLLRSLSIKSRFARIVRRVMMTGSDLLGRDRRATR